MTHIRNKIVYFAGSISKDDWRSAILGSRPGGLMVGGDEDDLWNVDYLEKIPGEEYGHLVYGGPFFVACDHGCAHGPATHGVTGSDTCGIWPFADRWIGSRLDDPLEKLRDKVFEVNLSRIKNARYIFAHVDKIEIFGTCAELGFARGLGREIFLSINPSLSNCDSEEFWFVKRMADVVVTMNAKDAWEDFKRRIGWRS